MSRVIVNSMASDPTSVTAELTPQDFEWLTDLVDGEGLRLALMDQAPCEAVENREVEASLVLDTVTLEKSIAGCSVSHVSDPEALVSLMELAHQY